MLKKYLITPLIIIRNYLFYKWFDLLSRLRTDKISTDKKANFLVSIASYPKRDHLLPAVFEVLNRQTVKPQKWILVLSVEEYPEGLPKHIEKLQSRGIEIIWSKENPYAVKKLIPVLERYPDLGIITFDDDLLYGKDVIKKLVEFSSTKNGAIVGHVGKELFRKGEKLSMIFRTPNPASLTTDPKQVYFLGGAGTIYPKDALDKKVLSLQAIKKIVPGRGSDIWFWGAAIAAGTEQYCLGTKLDKHMFIPIPQNNRTAPRDRPGGNALEERFQMTIDYFEIRDKLLENLPDINED